jgi:hypothetical protein
MPGPDAVSDNRFAVIARFCIIIRDQSSDFAAALPFHAGSDPAPPATKYVKYIRRLEPDVNRRVFDVPLYINATSTPHQKNRNSTDKRAAAGGCGHLILCSRLLRPILT